MQPYSVLSDIIATRFGGLIRHGKHEPDGAACLLEAAHAALGDPWSDAPDRWPDLRPLNDAPWSSDQARTEALVPVLDAYWDWAEWSRDQLRRVMVRVGVGVVQTIIAELPDLPDDLRARCRVVQMLPDAEQAARAVRVMLTEGMHDADAAAAAEGAAQVAWAASVSRENGARTVLLAARAAAEAAAAAAEAGVDADRVLHQACAIFCAAAPKKEGA